MEDKMNKFKITNKTFSPLAFTSVGTIPARGSIIVTEIPEELKFFQKKNIIDIKKVSN
jgi:hypothetical protein